MTATELLRTALKKEHERQLSACCEEERLGLALSQRVERADLDWCLLQIGHMEDTTMRARALNRAVFALAGVDP